MTIKGRIFLGLIVFFVFLLMVFFKVYLSARSEYHKGEEAFNNRDYEQAIIHFDRALHWYSPESKYIEYSMEALWEIGARAEKEENLDLSLQAYRSLRSGLYSARSFYTPHQDWIDKCDQRIADITFITQNERRSPAGRPYPPTKKEDILKILKTKTEPDVSWSIICEIGFLGWIGCSIAFILRVFSGDKGFNPRRAFFWGAFIVVFYAVWIVGMLNA